MQKMFRISLTLILCMFNQSYRLASPIEWTRPTFLRFYTRNKDDEVPTACNSFLQGNTQPPPRLSERDLIALMDSHGIGTDATVAEHIQKQLERGYATKDTNLTFWPTPLGEGLVGGYRRMGLQNLWLPDLR